MSRRRVFAGPPVPLLPPPTYSSAEMWTDLLLVLTLIVVFGGATLVSWRWAYAAAPAFPPPEACADGPSCGCPAPAGPCAMPCSDCCAPGPCPCTQGPPTGASSLPETP